MRAVASHVLWQRLKTISGLGFESWSRHNDHRRNVSGSGAVVVDCANDSCITFSESGTWTADSGLRLNFSNRYRWHRTASSGIIRLQHLRHGETRPVELVEFMLQPDLSWQSRTPHVCKNDVYHARITVRGDSLSVQWTVSGPEKSEYIHCIYS